MAVKKKTTKKKSTSAKVRRKLFPKEYVKCLFNATKAAENCGYSQKTARRAATRLLHDVEMISAINKEIESLAQKLDVHETRIMGEMMKIAFADIGNYVDIGPDGMSIRNLTDMDTSVIAEAYESYNDKTGHRTVKFKMHSKDKALEMLGRVKAMFTDKIEDTTPGRGIDLSGLSKAQLETIRELQQQIIKVIEKENAKNTA